MKMVSLPTPAYNILDEYVGHVYEPAEDTFLLLDALEKDAEVTLRLLVSK